MNQRPFLATGRMIAALLCLFVYALFLLTWVRSYWWRDSLSMDVGSRTDFHMTSQNGQVSASVAHTNAAHGLFQLSSHPITAVRIPLPRFQMRSNHPGHVVLELPHWFVALLFAAMAAYMRREFPYRFSLRALFIVTTVISILLGLITAWW